MHQCGEVEYLPCQLCVAGNRASTIDTGQHARTSDAMVFFIHSRQGLEYQIILLHAQGLSIRALTRHFTMGRNTIRLILRKNRQQREQGHDALKPPSHFVHKSKLNAFKPMIRKLLEKHPDIIGMRVCEELLDKWIVDAESA